MSADRQLSLLVDERPPPIARDLSAVVVGFWSAGERLMQVNGQHVFANVWFHFSPAGHALLSVRQGEELRARSSRGTWFLSDGMLVAEFGQTVISSPLEVDPCAEVMRWAGEVLHRLPHDVPTDESG